jgi:hypothetical protein
MLRWDYDTFLEIREEIPLGKMPPRLDLLILRRDPQAPLPFPFCHLDRTTLAEYKGPDDVADQEALVKLLGDVLDFQRRERQWQRAELTLWLIASNFAEDVSLPGGAEITGQRTVGPGVQQGTVDGFPICLIDLNDVPLAPATLPLLMVSKGRQERAVVEYLVDHAQEHPAYIQILPLLHPEVLTEVLTMRQMTVEEIGFERERLLNMVSPEALVRAMGVEQLVRAAGLEQIIQATARTYGPERIRELLEQIDAPTNPAEKDGPNPH